MCVQEAEQKYLHGVDITYSTYLDRPGPLEAAAFAAKAHAGHVRKSGEPYVQHCVQTALLTEEMVLHLFDTEEWSSRTYGPLSAAQLQREALVACRVEIQCVAFASWPIAWSRAGVWAQSCHSSAMHQCTPFCVPSTSHVAAEHSAARALQSIVLDQVTMVQC